MPSKTKEAKLLKTKYLDVDRTYYISNKNENYKFRKRTKFRRVL